MLKILGHRKCNLFTCSIKNELAQPARFFMECNRRNRTHDVSNTIKEGSDPVCTLVCTPGKPQSRTPQAPRSGRALKAPTLFEHKSPSGRCFILQSKRYRCFLYRTEIQFVQKLLLICGKRNIFELRCPMPYYSEGLFLLKYSNSLLAGVLY